MDLKKIKEEMDKKFGFNAVRVASELEEELFRIPSGSISLDIALGGGIPGGRMTHIAGDFSAGKSALAYHILANAQAMKKREIEWVKYKNSKEPRKKWVVGKTGEDLLVALLQFESHSYANDWGESCGLRINDLLISYPDGLEEGVDIAVALQRDYGVDVIAVDSYAAAKAIKELETDSQGTTQMAIKPKKLDDFHGKWQANNNKRSREGRIPCTLIALNQIREKIGGFSPSGQPVNYSPGGKSKDFTASCEVLLRKGEHITTGSGANKRAIGQVVKFKIQKNKTYIPFLTGSYDFYFDEGGPVPPGNIDNGKEIAIEAVAFDVIEQKGAFYYYKGEKIAHGSDNLIGYMRNVENAKVAEEIRRELMKVAFDEIKENPPEGTEEETE